MKSTKQPAAPSHLSAKAKRLWAAIWEEYDLDPEAAEILATALTNLDIGDSAATLVRREGLVVDGKRHPAADLVKVHHGLWLRAVRQLGLDIVAPGEAQGRRS